MIEEEGNKNHQNIKQKERENILLCGLFKMAFFKLFVLLRKKNDKTKKNEPNKTHNNKIWFHFRKNIAKPQQNNL